jgi:SulP family sulfate permease
VVIGTLGIVFLAIQRRWWPRIPGALILVAITTAITWWLGLDEQGVRIVGIVPGGLPAFAVPEISGRSLSMLLPTALAISLVGFVESIAISRVYAAKYGYEVDSNRELVALGLANAVGAFFRAYPSTGSFSRTAVNDHSGARTNVAAFFTAGIIVLTLVFLTDLFTYLPMATLGVVVIVAVSRLFDWREVLYLWRVDRRDLRLLLLTFFVTLLVGIEAGILMGVVASLVVVVHRSSRPYTAIIGRLPGTETYRNIERYPEALASDGTIAFRIDAPLFFANTGYLKSKLRALRSRYPLAHTLVLDFYAVNSIDSTGVRELEQLIEEFRDEGLSVSLAGIKGPVMDKLVRAGITEKIGGAIFEEVHEAVVAAEQL